APDEKFVNPHGVMPENRHRTGRQVGFEPAAGRSLRREGRRRPRPPSASHAVARRATPGGCMKPERMSLLVGVSLSLAPVYASPQGGGRSAPAACSLLSVGDLASLTGRKELANAKPIGGTGDEPGATNCGYVGTSLQVEIQPLQSV